MILTIQARINMADATDLSGFLLLGLGGGGGGRVGGTSVKSTAT